VVQASHAFGILGLLSVRSVLDLNVTESYSALSQRRGVSGAGGE